MAIDITIGTLLCNSEQTRAGSLDDFFVHLERLRDKIGFKTPHTVLVDDKTTDRSFEIASRYCNP